MTFNVRRILLTNFNCTEIPATKLTHCLIKLLKSSSFCATGKNCVLEHFLKSTLVLTRDFFSRSSFRPSFRLLTSSALIPFTWRSVPLLGWEAWLLRTYVYTVPEHNMHIIQRQCQNTECHNAQIWQSKNQFLVNIRLGSTHFIWIQRQKDIKFPNKAGLFSPRNLFKLLIHMFCGNAFYTLIQQSETNNLKIQFT